MLYIESIRITGLCCCGSSHSQSVDLSESEAHLIWLIRTYRSTEIARDQSRHIDIAWPIFVCDWLSLRGYSAMILTCLDKSSVFAVQCSSIAQHWYNNVRINARSVWSFDKRRRLVAQYDYLPVRYLDNVEIITPAITLHDHRTRALRRSCHFEHMRLRSCFSGASH